MYVRFQVIGGEQPRVFWVEATALQDLLCQAYYLEKKAISVRAAANFRSVGREKQVVCALRPECEQILSLGAGCLKNNRHHSWAVQSNSHAQ